MHRHFLWVLVLMFTGLARAAEWRFDIDNLPLNQAPTGCVSVVLGEGKLGNWKTMMDEEQFHSSMPVPALAPGTPATYQQEVVAQLAEDPTDEHFPMLILGQETFDDFTLTTKFKIVKGHAEQMAGIAFRMQDEKNFYVVRASALGKNVSFYAVVKGQRQARVWRDMEIPLGVWHELSVTCKGIGQKGAKIECSLDGNDIFQGADVTDSSFGAGRIAYWTKSDSVTYFADTHLVYTPREPFVQALVRATMAKYPRLLGLQIVMLTGMPPKPQLVASDKQREVGLPGRDSAFNVIHKGTVYYDKDGDHVTVTLPLRDRNGDAQAAVRVTMRTFKGQTEENAILHALPIVKEMQARAPASNDWNE
jgi:hypothetical protein